MAVGLSVPALTQAPVVIPGVRGATSVSGGMSSTCAVVSGGDVQCWGGPYLRLDDGVSLPVTVPGVIGATAIAAGEERTFAVVSGGSVRCWRPATAPEPEVLPGLTGVTAMAYGGAHACALMSDGSVRCWGDNEFGQLGGGKLPCPQELRPLSAWRGGTRWSQR